MIIDIFILGSVGVALLFLLKKRRKCYGCEKRCKHKKASADK